MPIRLVILIIVQQQPINDETIFRAYSVTKYLTQLLAGLMSRDGSVDLEAPIKTYLPNIPEALANITSEQLLFHRSGVRHYKSNDEWLKLSQLHCSSPKDAFDVFINDALVSKVGVEKHYSSFGYVLLSGVLEKASDKPFVALMEEYLFRPSGVKRIEFDNLKMNTVNNVSVYYEPIKGGHVIAPSIRNSCKFGGGGINSSPSEIVQIVSHFIAGRLSNQSLVDMVNALPTKLTVGGEGFGGRSSLVVYPKENLSVLLMANTRGGNLQPYTEEIAELFISD